MKKYPTWYYDMTYPLADATWAGHIYNDKFPVITSDHEWSYSMSENPNYEYDRIHSMAKLMPWDGVLVDIGEESGLFAAMYANFVNPEKMVIIEPQPIVWANIKATWEANKLPKPLATFCGFISDRTLMTKLPGHDVTLHDFPEFDGEMDYNRLLSTPMYLSLKEFSQADSSQLSLDDLVNKSGIIPAGVTMDVEGGEILVVRGASQTFRTHKPLVWISIHTGGAGPHDSRGSLAYDYNSSKEEVINLMESYGYKNTYLGFRQEEHWLFEPK